jgi:hypothetical protein
MHRVRSRDSELIGLLEAYAAQRLSPDAAAVARIRAAVMRDVEPLLARDADAAVIPLRARRATGSTRRVAAALLAAALGVSVVAGSAFAATPGGPLYPVRIWAETLALPADPDRRVEAEVGRLKARVGEAFASIHAGDHAGVRASLTAFRGIVDEALAGAGEDTDRLARLEAHLARLRLELERVLAQVPAQARGAVVLALAKTTEATDRIRRIKGRPGAPGHGPGPSSGHTPRPAGGPDGESGPKATKAPKPGGSSGSDDPDDDGRPGSSPRGRTGGDGDGRPDRGGQGDRDDS